MCRCYCPGLIGNRDGQNAYSVVIGQRQRPCARRQINGVRKKIRVSVRLGAAVGRVALRTEPGDVCPLNEARPQAQHLSVGIDARSYRSSSRRCWCARALLDYFFRSFPNAIVPLPNETSPVLDRSLNRFITDAEGGLLIAIGGGEQIDSIVLSGRKRDRLTVGHDRIGFAISGGSQVEANSTINDLARQQLGRQRLALGGALVVGIGIEAAICRSAHPRGDG